MEGLLAVVDLGGRRALALLWFWLVGFLRFGGRLGFTQGRFAADAIGLALDLSKGSQHIRVVRKPLQNAFIFEDGRGQLSHCDISLGNAFGGANDILLPAKLEVGFLKYFERLIVLGLRLSDDLEHLNR